jgi:hypothetical protein
MTLSNRNKIQFNVCKSSKWMRVETQDWYVNVCVRRPKLANLRLINLTFIQRKPKWMLIELEVQVLWCNWLRESEIICHVWISSNIVVTESSCKVLESNFLYSKSIRVNSHYYIFTTIWNRENLIRVNLVHCFQLSCRNTALR